MMNVDFSQMTGYEFEDYIAQLFKTLGFKVIQTNYSGDGGIDMYLLYDKPVFKGKYIVQCKNYKGLVGQPEIRDLYGVVMSESANKGIIITSSDFTEQAYSFADGKNLELINHQTLGILYSLCDKNCELMNPSVDSSSFIECSEFNRKRYDYLKQKTDNQPNEEKNYEELIGFLRTYIVNGDDKIISTGLVEEIIKTIHDCQNRCFRPKSKRGGRDLCSSREIEMLILTGDLATATRKLVEMGSPMVNYYITPHDFSIGLDYGEYKENYRFNTTHWAFRYLSREEEKRRLDDCKRHCSALKFDLYSAFKQIGYKRGTDSMSCKLQNISSLEDFEKYFHNSIPFVSVEELYDIYVSWLSGKYDDKFYFVKQSLHQDKKNKSNYSISKTIDGVGSTTYMKENYYKKEIPVIIDELEEVFDALAL